jgi:hypothetical protein
MLRIIAGIGPRRRHHKKPVYLILLNFKGRKSVNGRLSSLSIQCMSEEGDG